MIEQLIFLEQKYGGLIQGVPRKNLSSHDMANTSPVHQGGDRMQSIYHNYAPIYANYLTPFLNESCNIVEVGLLKGTGLAIWCDIFPTANIYGFDIDLNNYTTNYDNLLRAGAFVKNKPHVFNYDQYIDNSNYIGSIINNEKFNIVIDDGCHTNEANLQTLASFIPHLDDKFVYFIEDNTTIHDIIKQKYPQFNVFYHDQMTVIQPK
jgi:hypothetical protein